MRLNLDKMKTLLNYLLNKQWILSIVMCFFSEGNIEQIFIVRLRAEMLFWGHDTSQITDEEIKDGINKIGEIIAQCGFTTNEITNAMRAMANCTEHANKYLAH